jgi:hypothetical protein
LSLARIAAVAAGLCLGGPAFAFLEKFSVSPSAPVAGQEFTLTISGATGCIPVKLGPVVVNGTRIEVHAQGSNFCFGAAADYIESVALRVPAAGEYDVTYQFEAGPVGSLGKLAVAPPNSAATLDGIWYDPAAPGSGFSVTEGANGNLFVVWFTYRNYRQGQPYTSHRDEPSWYMVSGGTRVSPTEFRGTLHRTTNLQREQPYSVQALQAEAIGTATLTIRGDGKLEFTTTNSVTPPLTVVLQKFDF